MQGMLSSEKEVLRDFAGKAVKKEARQNEAAGENQVQGQDKPRTRYTCSKHVGDIHVSHAQNTVNYSFAFRAFNNRSVSSLQARGAGE